MLNVKSVYKSFKNLTVLNDLSFNVKESSISVFLGINGAGKTTTMKIISGILKQDSGDIFIDNVSMNDNPTYCKKITGYVQDRPYFYEKLSVREFLKFIGSLYSIDNNIIDNKIFELLHHYQLENKIDTLIENLSHGMRQRLAICAELIHFPKLLIIDEPTVGLDPYGIKLLEESLREYAKNKMAILISTHSLDIASKIGDNIIIIDKGKIVKNFTIEEINKNKNSTLEDFFISATNSSYKGYEDVSSYQA